MTGFKSSESSATTSVSSSTSSTSTPSSAATASSYATLNNNSTPTSNGDQGLSSSTSSSATTDVMVIRQLKMALSEQIEAKRPTSMNHRRKVNIDELPVTSCPSTTMTVTTTNASVSPVCHLRNAIPSSPSTQQQVAAVTVLRSSHHHSTSDSKHVS